MVHTEHITECSDSHRCELIGPVLRLVDAEGGGVVRILEILGRRIPAECDQLLFVGIFESIARMKEVVGRNLAADCVLVPHEELNAWRCAVSWIEVAGGRFHGKHVAVDHDGNVIAEATLKFCPRPVDTDIEIEAHCAHQPPPSAKAQTYTVSRGSDNAAVLFRSTGLQRTTNRDDEEGSCR